MTEYSRMAKGNFTASGPAATPLSAIVNLPFLPDYVELWNYSVIKTAATHSVLKAWWDNKLIDPVTNSNPTMVELYAGAATSSVYDTIQTNGISVFQGALSLQYGPVVAHGATPVSDFSITKATPAGITTVGNHGLNSGDVVIFSGLLQTSTTGMQQIAGIPFTVTVTGATTFTIPWDTTGSNYTAFNTATSTNNVGSYKKVLYPYLYFPGASYIGSIVNGANTTISTTDAHNFVVGQEVAIRIPTVAGVLPPAWGPTQLNSLPNNVIPGSPIYGFVVSVTDYHTVVVNINSTGFTAFNNNIPFTSVSGMSFPQIVAVGDVNTGGVQISAGSPLYPSPQFNPIGTTKFSTINGPAIQGAFVNNTSQGFVIGAGTAAVDTTSSIMTNGNIIYWHAYAHDLGIP